MAVIGARELQPVNVLGSFVQGMEAGRSTLAQRQEALKANQLAMRQQALDEAIAAGGLESEQGRMRLQRMPGGLDALKSFGAVQEQMGKGVEAQTKGLSSRMQFFRQNIPFNPQGAATWLANAYADPVVGAELLKMGTLEEAIAAIPTDPAGYLRWMEGASMLADAYAQRATTSAEQELTAATTRRGQDVTVRGQDITAATTRRGQDITAETTRRGQDITMRGQDINATIQSPEYQGLITQARERAKADVGFSDQFNAADQTARRTLSLLDSIIGDAQIVDNKIVVQEGKRKPMKGFSQAVGAAAIPGQRFIPGTAARDFNAAHDQAVGAAFMQAFATLKGGGQITEKEGEKATAALTRMNLAQSEVEYIRAAKEFQKEVKNVLNLAETRYKKLNPSYQAPPAPGAATPSIDDLLKKYE